MSDIDTFLVGRGDNVGREVRLIAAGLRRARRDARRCTDGPRGSRLRRLPGHPGVPRGDARITRSQPYLGYAPGKLAGEDRALEAALRLRELLAEVERDDA